MLATTVLALAVLFRSPFDYRMVLCIIVSAAATTQVVHCPFGGKLLWTLPFLGILSVLTAFQFSRFPHQLISLDMASLALLAASPMILRKSTMAVARPGRF